MHYAAFENRPRFKPRGFTLVEMLIVMLLAAIIIVMGVVAFRSL